MVIKIPQQVNTVIEILNANGHSAYVVGGACRDILMDKSAHDWDVTTSALPEETSSLFSDFRVIETGIKHGTVTVIVDSVSIEVTTYRIESGYSDNRHPDSVSFTDKIEDDLARRDFTVNAIAYSPISGTVDHEIAVGTRNCTIALYTFIMDEVVSVPTDNVIQRTVQTHYTDGYITDCTHTA